MSTQFIKMESENIELLTEEDILLILDSVKSFSKQKILPFLQNDLPDGDLNKMKEAIEELYELGIITYPDENSEGLETGVWGLFSNEMGAQHSLMILMEIAKTCGSTAFVVHNQGVASNILNAFKININNSKKISFALQDSFGMPYVGTLKNPHINEPAGIETRAIKKDGNYILNGKKMFVYMQEDTNNLIVPALLEGKWAVFVVPANAKGVNYEDVGLRTGLRFLQLNHILFDNVELKPDSLIATDKNALDLLKRSIAINWLGISAIATGIAQGSILAAEQYAGERYQGGTLIKNHGAIKTLFATSYTKTKLAASILKGFVKIKFDFNTLQTTAQTKLAVLDQCSQVVSDMLQVFGGYGYMQDYRMEKRLRDIQVLKLTAGSPIFLKKFIYDITQES
ncbi:MAG: hypothetical protein DRJ10_16280 [Bacteroidetes bacterium]|nr:MAG: hypothetical protein DRJ10_16280 [Bacteroidota bacterium]